LVSSQPLDAATKAKISMFCHVAPEQVVGVHDLSSVYHVPLLLESQGEFHRVRLTSGLLWSAGIIQLLQKRLNLTAISIPSVLVDKGKDLAKRWRVLTQTRVLQFNKIFD
jgi:CTP synthase